MKTAALALVMLAACGSGAAHDPVTHVRLSAEVSSASGAHTGWSSWDDRGSEILIPEDASTGTRLIVLKHELWHQLTRIEGHLDDPECVSDGDGSLEWWQRFQRRDSPPCPEEVDDVNAIGRVVTPSFPEDAACARTAADWWNTALGREAVLVVE